MPFTPQPDSLATMFAELNRRVRCLETRLTGVAHKDDYTDVAATTSSTTYVDLGDPAVEVTLGANAAARIDASCYIGTPGAGVGGVVGLFIDGALVEGILTLSCDAGGVASDASSHRMRTTDAGGHPFELFSTHSFALKYKVTGSAGTVTFGARALTVSPL